MKPVKVSATKMVKRAKKSRKQPRRRRNAKFTSSSAPIAKSMDMKRTNKPGEQRFDAFSDVCAYGSDILGILSIEDPVEEEPIQPGDILFRLDLNPSDAIMDGTRLKEISGLWQMYKGAPGKIPFRVRLRSAAPATAVGQYIIFSVYGPDDAERVEELSAEKRLRFAFTAAGMKSANVWESVDFAIPWPKGYTTLYTRPASAEAEFASFASVFVIAVTAMPRPTDVAEADPYQIGSIVLEWELKFIRALNQELFLQDKSVQIIARTEVTTGVKELVPPEMYFDLPATTVGVTTDAPLTRLLSRRRSRVGGFLSFLGDLIKSVFPVAGVVVDVVDGVGRLFKGIKNNDKKEAQVEVGSRHTTGTDFGTITPVDYPVAPGIQHAYQHYGAWSVPSGENPQSCPTGAAYGTPGVEVSTSSLAPGYIGGSYQASGTGFSGGGEPSSFPDPLQFRAWHAHSGPAVINGATKQRVVPLANSMQRAVVTIPPGETWAPYPYLTPGDPVDPVISPNTLYNRLDDVGANQFDGRKMSLNEFSGVSQANWTMSGTAAHNTIRPPRGDRRKVGRISEVVRDIARRWYSFPIHEHPHAAKIVRTMQVVINTLEHSVQLYRGTKDLSPTRKRFYSRYLSPSRDVAAFHMFCLTVLYRRMAESSKWHWEWSKEAHKSFKTVKGFPTVVGAVPSPEVFASVETAYELARSKALGTKPGKAIIPSYLKTPKPSSA